MSQMTLKYFIDLASNIGQRARADAQMLTDSQRRMDESINRTADRVVGLQRHVGQITNGSNTQRHIDYFDRLARSVENVKQRAMGLRQTLASGLDKLPEIGAAGTAAYFAGSRVMLPPMRAFSDLESATVDLKVALTNSAGKVDKSFGSIAAEAERLGKQLPGSTKDFMAGARTLIEQGMTGEQVAGGGLSATSNFGVLLNLDPATAARTIAKTREAYGLGPNDFNFAADQMQRARYGFGIDPGDFLEVGRYAAPTYNALGLTGRDNFKSLLAVQGMAAGVGLEASSFGTNFSQMLSRLAEVNPKLGGNRKKSKEMSALLEGKDIDLTFYNQQGEFSGVENMLKQLSKLRSLSTLDRQRVLTDLFGQEASRPAMILADKGMEEYQKALAKLQSQADLDTRITMKMESFALKLDALGGTIEGVMARIAAPLGNASKPMIERVNSGLGSFGDWVGEHPVAGTAGFVGTGVAATLLAGRAGLGGLRMLRRLRSPNGGAAVMTAPAAVAATEGTAAAAATAAKLTGQAARDARLSALRTGMSDARASNVKTMQWAALERQMNRSNRAAGLGRFAMKALPWLGLGLDSYGVLSDDNLTGTGKARGMGSMASGFGGAWGGASAGAALGTMVFPGVGTVVGGLAGGALGYMGGRKTFDSVFTQDPRRDFVKLTAPNGTPLANAQSGQQTTVQLGEGKLNVQISVSDTRIGTTMQVLQQPSLIRINPGATNPAGF